MRAQLAVPTHLDMAPTLLLQGAPGPESEQSVETILNAQDSGNLNDWMEFLSEDFPEVGKPPYLVLPARLPPFTHQMLRTPFSTRS